MPQTNDNAKKIERLLAKALTLAQANTTPLLFGNDVIACLEMTLADVTFWHKSGSAPAKVCPATEEKALALAVEYANA